MFNKDNIKNESVTMLDLSKFVEVDIRDSVRQVIAQMKATKHNCALIVENDILVGIFTDRDILRKVIGFAETLEQSISELMTKHPATVDSQTSIADAIFKMESKHYRNLPVVDKHHKIVGNLTSYSLMCAFTDCFARQIYNLPPNPECVCNKREGA